MTSKVDFERAGLHDSAESPFPALGRKSVVSSLLPGQHKILRRYSSSLQPTRRESFTSCRAHICQTVNGSSSEPMEIHQRRDPRLEQVRKRLALAKIIELPLTARRPEASILDPRVQDARSRTLLVLVVDDNRVAAQAVGHVFPPERTHR